MSSFDVAERIEILLALALTFAKSQMTGTHEEIISTGETDTLWKALSELSTELNPSDQQALANRAEQCAKLTQNEQFQWVQRTLEQARANRKFAFLDEHTHPSHITIALREEPRYIQLLVLRSLPRSVAEATAAALKLVLPSNSPHDRALTEGLASDGPLVSDNHESLAADRAHTREIFVIVQRVFLSHFVTIDELRQPRDLDLLTRAELARLVWLLGVRETAIACRGIPAIEALAPFLRRFPAEDARAIASHIPNLTNIEPQRVAFAEQLINASLSLELAPKVVLNHIGMQMLAVSLGASDAQRWRFTAQKIPVEVAKELVEMIAHHRHHDKPEMIGRIAEEIEALAAKLRRETVKDKKSDALY